MSLGAGFSHQSGSSSSTLEQLINQLFSQSSTTSGSGSTSGSTSGTASEARVLSPEQQAAQTSLGKIINSISANPGQFLAPAQNQAREEVNQNYGGLADSLRQQFMGGTGGGSSGKYGTAALKGDLARRGALSGVDNTFAVAQSQLPLTAAALSQNLLNTNLGTVGTTAGKTVGTTEQSGVSNTSGSSSSTTTGSQTGKTSGSGFQVGGSI